MAKSPRNLSVLLWDINCRVLLNSFTHLESVMNQLLVVQLTCQ